MKYLIADCFITVSITTILAKMKSKTKTLTNQQSMILQLKVWHQLRQIREVVRRFPSIQMSGSKGKPSTHGKNSTSLQMRSWWFVTMSMEPWVASVMNNTNRKVHPQLSNTTEKMDLICYQVPFLKLCWKRRKRQEQQYNLAKSVKTMSSIKKWTICTWL